MLKNKQNHEFDHLNKLYSGSRSLITELNKEPHMNPRGLASSLDASA